MHPYFTSRLAQDREDDFLRRAEAYRLLAEVCRTESRGRKFLSAFARRAASAASAVWTRVRSRPTLHLGSAEPRCSSPTGAICLRPSFNRSRNDSLEAQPALGHAVAVIDQRDQPRLAAESDVLAVHEIIRVAYSKYLPRMDLPPAPMLQDMRPRIQADQVWVTGRPITGVICLIPADQVLLIESLAVHPNAQDRGLGRRLMDFAEDEARRLGLDRLQLYTNEAMTENVAIYTHLGYRELDHHTEEGYRRVFMERVLQPR